MNQIPSERTFDSLLEADLERVYQQGKDEMLRRRAFMILLGYADTVAKLVKIAFEAEHGAVRWTVNELLEISNRFRLMSSPENEIRLYKECRNEAFRTSPRVREFYVLALNKAGHTADAIREASEIIAESGQNALIWGALAESHISRMLFAEALQTTLTTSDGPPPKDKALATRCGDHFPEIAFDDLTPALAEALRQENLQSATRIFRQGFHETGEPFPGLGWMHCTIDHLCDRVVERDQLRNKRATGLTDASAARMRLIQAEINTFSHELDCQARLIGVALELQGGRESRDYWTHATYIQLAIVRNTPEADYRLALDRLLASVDAGFKVANTLAMLARIRDRFAKMDATASLDHQDEIRFAAHIQRIDTVAACLEAVRIRFATSGMVSTTPTADPNRVTEAPAAITSFLEKTINFCALTGNLVPLTIPGTIGRVGARVPDLLINRRVQEDLRDLVEDNILPALHDDERTDPIAVARRILRVVGTALNIGALQDLRSSAHVAFDMRSDGLIALSGVDHDMRKDTETGTDLTAAMLMQNCDCRETMYLNGALFACWQQISVKNCLARAMRCLEVGFERGFERILNDEIPALLRFQLRGGQVDVYVDAMGMISKYQQVRHSADDDTAVKRTYGLRELQAGVPLTRYELEQSMIEVRYTDGSTAWLTPKDPATGRWRPIEHTPVGEGGLPRIDRAGQNYDKVADVRLCNLVESHALTFLYDTQLHKVQLFDGFYNEWLFERCPYEFGSGDIDIQPILTEPRLIRAGNRTVVAQDGARERRPVHLHFLRYSRADYSVGLTEGDTPEIVQLMGRTFKASFRRERRRLEEGVSPIPGLLQRIHDWQSGRDHSVSAQRSTLDRQLTKLVLDLAKENPGLLQLHEITADEPLIREGLDTAGVYLVLAGKLTIWRNGAPLRGENGEPITVGAGSILGEISLLNKVVATATVSGDAVVLGIAKHDIRNRLANHPELQHSMEELAHHRIAMLIANDDPII